MSHSATTTAQRTESAARSPERTSGQRMNRMAVWGFVLALLTLGGVGSVVGMVLGAKARNRIATTGERGAGLALAAIVVGVLTLIGAVVYWVLIAQHLGGGGGGGGTGSGGGGGGY